MRWFVMVVLTVATATGVGGADPMAPTYAIRLERPFREGQVLAISLTIASTMVQRLQVGEELLPRKVERHLRLVCQAKVLRATDENWEQLQVTPTVAEAEENGVKTALTPLGQPLLVTRAAETVKFAWADGQALPTADEKLLGSFFREPGKVTPDAAFGPDRPVAVGDTWAAHPDQVSAMLAATGLGTVKPEAIAGRFALETAAGTPPRLRVKGTVQCPDFTAAAGKVARVKIETADLTMNIEYDLAADPQAADRVARLEIDWGYSGSQERPDGMLVRESLRHHNVREETLKQLPPPTPKE